VRINLRHMLKVVQIGKLCFRTGAELQLEVVLLLPQ
jgi:hypothetical protein